MFDEADILVIPTQMEAFGIALVEGLIKGLPCIGTTVGNQQWLIGDAGLTVTPGRLVRERYSLEPSAAALDQLYRKTTASVPGPLRRAGDGLVTMARVAQHKAADRGLIKRPVRMRRRGWENQG